MGKDYFTAGSDAVGIYWQAGTSGVETGKSLRMQVRIGGTWQTLHMKSDGLYVGANKIYDESLLTNSTQLSSLASALGVVNYRYRESFGSVFPDSIFTVFFVWLENYDNRVAVYIGKKDNGAAPALYKLAGAEDVVIGATNAMGTVAINIPNVATNITDYKSLSFYV